MSGGRRNVSAFLWVLSAPVIAFVVYAVVIALSEKLGADGRARLKQAVMEGTAIGVGVEIGI